MRDLLLKLYVIYTIKKWILLDKLNEKVGKRNDSE